MAAEPRLAADMIEISLDGKRLLVQPGSTILEAAESRGVRIPTLCHDKRLDPYASCWVCLVQVEKARGFVPSCSTRVAPGMVITSSAPQVTAARRMALELILSNHYGDCKAPCTLTCPSNIDIQGYLGLVANGKLREAADLIRRDNPMPAVIGRICPRPCERKCRRDLVEEPLNINGVKRFVADFEAAAGGMQAQPVPAPNGKKAVVVGGGPAGLSAAWYLSEKGVAVTILEGMEKAGGMLRYGIPDYRLPPPVLDQAISQMTSLGVVLKTGIRLGGEVTLEKLRSEYDAVVLAFGAWRSRRLRIPGENHPAVLSGIDFLRDVNEGRPVKVGEVVAVVGGGNTALDAARCSLRHGASKVTMYYRRTREEMPAADAEIEEAIEEGIEIQYLAAPVSIEASDGDALKTLTLLQMKLGEPDASGRRRPVPVEGSEYKVPVDTVICAVGQYADTRLLGGVPGLVDEKGNLQADLDTGRTEVPGVFAAGDLLTGTDIAIRAIAGGKHAARAALAYLEGRAYKRPKEFLSRKADFKEPVPADFASTARAPRAQPVIMEPERRKRSFAEIESTLTADAARAEAARCLECGCQDVRDCALKQHATEYDARATRFQGEITVHPVDESHPFISRDPSKCVLCGRCIRICLEVQAVGVFGYINRGFASVVAPSFGVPFGEDASCISCGQCVSACPVGALTEKLPAKKNVPLLEKAVEGTCTRCSVGCAVEYRWHGSLFTRIVERNGAPNHGKLCREGKFGHQFLNDPIPEPVTLPEAQGRLDEALGVAKNPVMRISPYLSGETIDAFLQAAARRGIPARAAGLERVDARWAQLMPAKGACAEDAPQLVLLVGDLGSTNNVAFTEAYRRRRSGAGDLWVLGHDSEPARRAASRVIADVPSGIAESLATGLRVAAWVNPEEAPSGALDALLSVRGKLEVQLFWGSRNAGYLFTRQTAAKGAADLYLDVGVEESANGTRRIAWGTKRKGDEHLFIPLPRELWILGRSHPTGMPSTTSGKIDLEVLKEAAALL